MRALALHVRFIGTRCRESQNPPVLGLAGPRFSAVGHPLSGEGDLVRCILGVRTPHPRSGVALEVIRVSVATLILIHGMYRLAMGGVAPFGVWLETRGFPAGYAFALAVTLIELVCPTLILLRRCVFISALLHIFILTLGVVMVHSQFGWFVVGAGRNGMEYSILLIVCLASVGWSYAPTRASSGPTEQSN